MMPKNGMSIARPIAQPTGTTTIARATKSTIFATPRRQNDAGLHANPTVLHGQNAAEIAVEIEDQPATKGFAGQARAGAAGVNRQVVFRRIAHGGDNVVHRARTNHAQRLQLINARVAGVELCRHVVAKHVALQQATQVFFDSLLVGIHGQISDFGLRITD